MSLFRSYNPKFLFQETLSFANVVLAKNLFEHLQVSSCNLDKRGTS